MYVRTDVCMYMYVCLYVCMYVSILNQLNQYELFTSIHNGWLNKTEKHLAVNLGSRSRQILNKGGSTNQLGSPKKTFQLCAVLGATQCSTIEESRWSSRARSRVLRASGASENIQVR